MQRIVDLIATAEMSETVTKIQNLLDGFKAAGQAITALSQGQSDRNHIYANKSTVNLATGAVASTSGIFIQQATTERAGAMRAQQVVDLNAARRDVADLQKQLAALETLIAELQEALGLGDGSTLTNVINNSQISCQVVDGKLHILGATKLIAAGYVLYLFLLTRKRNQISSQAAVPHGVRRYEVLLPPHERVASLWLMPRRKDERQHTDVLDQRSWIPAFAGHGLLSVAADAR